ncbi:GntR family transcriptional regulator [Paraburkholderia megapolitana]|uniref:DNA-binding transcriptional regulator, GntR family n=1 Tax=Paraburkholderia megapolitana TaxID=420953 RepID=A0A1I3LFV2_9BURK|nr:GntR family transcriptional regulator [Paraburkholderia megapolitana]QDQ80687.1 GntR family transcriptional regulator [Paraburkholderia megapolitana]SFI83255.1 DNA-binding transcriptional regulator, GntR family [Paraburkholderia megapolitana]
MKKSADAKVFSESLSDRLRERILRGELAPGTQLRQDRIAEEFGTSHIPVREAFIQLEARGFVTIVPNRGAFVSSMTRDEAEELQAMRVALELLALDAALDAFTAADVATARAALDQDAHATEVDQWSKDNWAFHRAIYAPSDKRHLMEALESLWQKADRYLRLVWQLAAYQDTSFAEHTRILAAVEAKDRRLAKRLTKEHITDAGVVMIEALHAHRSK